MFKKTRDVILITCIILIVAFILGFFIYRNFPSNLTSEQLGNYKYDTLTLPGGMDVNYKINGPDDAVITIVLVHGGGDSLDTWNTWVKILEKKYKIVRFDLPGHGLTDPIPKSEYGPKRFSEFINEVVDYMGLSNFVIAGHSFGGDSVMRFVLSYPGKPRALILVDAGGLKPNNGVEINKNLVNFGTTTIGRLVLAKFGNRDFVEKTLKENFYGNPDHIDYNLLERKYRLSRYEKNRGAAMSLVLNSEKEYEEVSGLDAVNIPTLLLWCNLDKITPLSECGKRYEQEIPGSKLIVYEGIGHMSHNENAEQSGLDTLKFLRNIAK